MDNSEISPTQHTSKQIEGNQNFVVNTDEALNAMWWEQYKSETVNDGLSPTLEGYLESPYSCLRCRNALLMYPYIQEYHRLLCLPLPDLRNWPDHSTETEEADSVKKLCLEDMLGTITPWSRPTYAKGNAPSPQSALTDA